jgi:uncharacterized repeat protein (TIGR01451 family)/LPXTG-motif cell wall-anchored protein
MSNVTVLNKTKMATGLMSLALSITFLGSNNVVYANCTSDGAYGQKCERAEDFDIDKDVRFVGDDTWKDKLTKVKKGQRIEFKITVKNTDDVEVDSMKMVDFLPDELEFKGGDKLVQYWQDFSAGEKKTFIFEAQVKDSEYNRSNFEKCVVNKAEAYYSDDEVGSDSAKVCYSDKDIEELPRTGPIDDGMLALAGLVSTGLGLSIKLFLRKYLA